MPRRRIGSGWRGEFSREPLGVYQEKERERAVGLVTKAVESTYTAGPPIPKLGESSRAAFLEMDMKRDPYVQAGLPPLPTKQRGGGGWKSRLRSAGGTAMAFGGEVLEKAAIPGQVIQGAVTAPFGDQRIDPTTGQVSREYSPGSILRGAREIGTDLVTVGLANERPERIAQERQQREAAGIRNPGGITGPFQSLRRESDAFQASNAPAGVKVGVAVGLDPTTWVAPGSVAKFLPAAARTSRGAKIAGAIFETPGRVGAGATLGAAGAAQFGGSIPGLKEVPERWRPLAGGLAGGLAPSVAGGLRNAGRAAARGDVFEPAPVSSVTEGGPPDREFRGTTPERFAEELPTNKLADLWGSLENADFPDVQPLRDVLAAEVNKRGLGPVGERPGKPTAAKPKQTVYHGTAGDLDGPLRKDAFVTANRADAEAFARAESRISGKPPRVYSVEVEEGALRDVTEEGLASARGAKQIADPSRARLGMAEDVSPKTVKRKNIFGEVEDTNQTEAELNGWRESQGALFDRGPKQPDLSKGPPSGQKGFFDLFDEGPKASVAPRRQRMANVEGNDVVRMRGDQIAEALGLDKEFARRYRKLDALVRNQDGSPNKNHPRFEERENVRKELTRMYVERNGRQPVIVRPPGERAARYSDIDERVAARTPEELAGTDTGGEFEGRFDTDNPKNQRIMQLEKIANDPNASPSMRQKARQRLNEEQGIELTGREPGEGSFAEPRPQKGKLLAQAYGGPQSPAAIALRAGAGYAQAKLEGEDNSEALKQSILAAVPASVARTALKAGKLDDNLLLGAVAKGEDSAGDVPINPLPRQTVPHEQIQVRPDLFQGRKTDPGTSFKESRVREITENFDPAQLEPGILMRDTATGDLIVVAGHHRLEAMKRLAAEGKVPPEGEWRVIEGDVNNPADVALVQKISRITNFSQAQTTLVEKLDTMRVLEDAGDSPGAIQGQMRLSQSEFEDLSYINRVIPADVIDRLEELPRGAQEAAAEIAKAAAKYDLSEQDVRAAIQRYIFAGGEKARTRGQIAGIMQAAGEASREVKAAGLQATLFGDDDIETILRQVDLLKEKQDEILSLKRKANTEIGMLQRTYADNPNQALADAANVLRQDAERRVAELEAQLEELQRGWSEQKARGFNAQQVEELPEDLDDLLDTPAPAGGMGDMFAAGPELPPARGVAEPQPIGSILELPELPRANLPAQRFEGTEGPYSDPLFAQRADATPGNPNPNAVTPDAEDLRYDEFRQVGDVNVPAAGRGASDQPLGDLLAADTQGLNAGAVPAAGRGASARPLGDLLEPDTAGLNAAGVARPVGGQPGFAQRADAAGDSTRYRAEIDDAEAARINDEWTNLGESTKLGPEATERGGWINKLLIEWPSKASRVAFTAATSGDIGSGMIQSAYTAWTHPKQWAKSMKQSFQAFGSATARQGAREHTRALIEASVPEDMRASIFDRVFKAGFSITRAPSEMSGDIGASVLESTKLGPLGAWFRGSRRQFETQTEHMRTDALVNIFKAQRAANIAKGLGDTIMEDQLRGAVNVANHLSGATKAGMHPAAGIAFGAPRFLMSQFALLSDAFVGKGVSANYARKELVKSLGMIVTATGVANLATSNGKDFFGPGLGGPQDIDSWEDFRKVITSPNFGRVRVADADVSLFGPLDPLARAFFNEFANLEDVLKGADDSTLPGTDFYHAIENKASPLARAVLDTAAGENKFTGEQYSDFGDYFTKNMERLMPIFAQNALEAFEGKGSWANVGVEFIGLKSSPTTPYERATGILDSVPGEYWVVDVKNNQLRPPQSVYELTAEQRAKLRTEEPAIDAYLRKRETDPDRPFMAQLTDQYVNVQTYWDAELKNGNLPLDAWRRQFIANQKQLKQIRERNPDSATYEPTTRSEKDLDDYFAIWDDPEVDSEGAGLNYELADQKIAALRARLGNERWSALEETLAWNKSPVVSQYLKDMQIYNEFLNTNPKYLGVDPSQTRKVDAAVTRVRQLQASNPGLPGKAALYELRDRGEIDDDTMLMGRTALSRKYSAEYSDWRGTEDGERVTAWFKPVVEGDYELETQAAIGKKGVTLRAGRGSSGAGSKRRRAISR